jgi:Ca2+-binding RTX toxin-like protein
VLVSKKSLLLGVTVLVMLVLLGWVIPVVNLVQAHKHNNLLKHVDVTTLKELGDKIGGLSASSGVRFGNVITCAPSTTCIGTNGEDIIYGGANSQVFGLGGNDIIFGGADNQIYGGKGNSILVAGGGNNLLDANSGTDVLLGGGGNDLLVGGSGNNKIFAGSGNAVMFGGSGAAHFDCPTSTTGATKAVVLDYNPIRGDTISGTCKIVNTVSSSNPGSNVPHVNVPTTTPGTVPVPGPITTP